MAGPRDPGRFPVFVTCRRWGRFPVFATCPVEILAHSQTIADQGEKKDRHFEFHSSRRTSSTALSPWPLRGFTPGPCNQDPDGAACWSLEGAGPRPARSIRPRLFRAPAGRRQTYDDGRSIARLGYEGGGDVIVPSRRPSDGDSRLVRARSPDPPVLCDRRLRPAGASPGDPRSAERRGRENAAERFKFATKAVGIRGRSRPTLQHATVALIIPDRAFYQCMQKMR